VEHLDRDHLVELEVTRAVDRAHASGSEEIEEVVAVAEDPVDERGAIGRRDGHADVRRTIE
jgi:hypothetical protein